MAKRPVHAQAPGYTFCALCGAPWPCDPSKTAAKLRAGRAAKAAKR